jgi:hypothetical protein
MGVSAKEKAAQFVTWGGCGVAVWVLAGTPAEFQMDVSARTIICVQRNDVQRTVGFSDRRAYIPPLPKSRGVTLTDGEPLGGAATTGASETEPA